MIGDGPVARGFADGHQVGFERLLPRVTWRGDPAVASLPAGQNIARPKAQRGGRGKGGVAFLHRPLTLLRY
jgi:hypothetical protein